MLPRDFFAFCTSLKPAELKLLGRLSSVIHLEAGRTLYSPGDPGDAIYIVNRGGLEVLPPNARENTRGIVLERGDIAGEVEAFGHMTRSQLIRARGPVSLQCFPRTNFQELLRRVPSFYYYLCEQMAQRLGREREESGKPDRLLELGGQLSNFDLPTIYQAILQSSRTGELTLCDLDRQIVGAFYFVKGRLRAGWFHHLAGQEAFWQLFLEDALTGSFLFTSGDQLVSDEWLAARWIDRNETEIILSGLQYRDELHALRRSLKPELEKLSARAMELKWDKDSHRDLHQAAVEIWKQLTRGPSTIDQLFRQGTFCELKVYQVVAELLRSGQISFGSENNSLAEVPEPAFNKASVISAPNVNAVPGFSVVR